MEKDISTDAYYFSISTTINSIKTMFLKRISLQNQIYICCLVYLLFKTSEVRIVITSMRYRQRQHTATIY